MDGSRNQLLPGAALAANQYGGVRTSHTRDKLINLEHTGTFPDHVMLDVDDSIESLVFALQPLHAPEILQRGRNNAANGGEELNVFFIKTLFGAADRKSTRLNSSHQIISY